MAPANVYNQQSEKGSQNFSSIDIIAPSTSMPKTDTSLGRQYHSVEAQYYEKVDKSPLKQRSFETPCKSNTCLTDEAETATDHLLQSNKVDEQPAEVQAIENRSSVDEDKSQPELSRMRDEPEVTEHGELMADVTSNVIEGEGEEDIEAEVHEADDNFLHVDDEIDENDIENEAEAATIDTSSSDDVCSFLARLDAETDVPEEADGQCGDRDADCDSDDCDDNPDIDKGYAWIICLAVFFIQFLFVGFLKSGGVLFVEFQKQFQATSSMTSLIIGLEEAVCSIGSFICLSFVVKKVTPRNLCLIGSCFCLLGVAGCALCVQIEQLIVTYSFGFGIAISCNYATSILVLNQYFVKRRALAVSLATSGTSVGGIVLPLLIRFLLDEYQYTGGILIFGAFMAHVFISAILLIPVENHKKKTTTSKLGSRATNLRDMEEAVAAPKSTTKPGNFHRLLLQKLKARDGKGSSKMADGRNGSLALAQQHQYHHSNFTNGTPNIYKPSAPVANGKGGLTFDVFNSKLEICEEGVPLKLDTPAYFEDNNADVVHTPTATPIVLSPLDDIIRWASNGKLPNATDTTSPFGSISSHINVSNPSIYLSPDYQSRYRSHVSSMRSGLDSDSNCGSESQHPTNRNISKLSSSKQTLSTSFMFHSTTTLHTLADLVTTDIALRSHNLPDGADYKSATMAPKSPFQRLRETFNDNPLSRSVSFWLLALFFFCGCIGHALPQVYIPALAKERGLSDEDGAFFISVLNIMDIPSHLIPGVLITLGVARATRICVLPMFIVGVISHLTFLYNSYESILCMSILLGLFGGFYFAMQSVIIIEILGMTYFASTIGVYFLGMGMGAAVSFPIAGVLRDISGSYSASYHYLASVDLVATAILVCIPLARKYDIRRGVLKE